MSPTPLFFHKLSEALEEERNDLAMMLEMTTEHAGTVEDGLTKAV